MVRTILKNSYFATLSVVGIDRLRRKRLVRERKAAVLNLHRVSPHSSPYWPPMHPDIFDRLLQYLDRHFEIRSVSDLGEKQGKRPIAVLSFDDGYYDYIEYALPHLRKYGMRANMNIIPQCAETGRPIWNVRLYDYLAKASVAEIRRIHLPGFEQKLADDKPVSKLKYGIALSRFLKARPRTDRVGLFQQIEETIAKTESPSTRMMTSDEIRQIASEAELGAHSYSHESMEFEDNDFFQSDLNKCTDYFENQLSLPMKIYAFPNGSYRKEQIGFLRKKGVSKILLVDEKFAGIEGDVIPRITMYGDSDAEVRIRALSG